MHPRTNARWPSRSAMIAHDAQCAAAGVTTVLDALCIGDLGFENDRIQTFRDAVTDLDALAGTALLKAEHFLHLRCELPARDMLDLLDPVIDHPAVRLISLMDHSPGVGQYADLDYYVRLRRKDGTSLDVIERRITELQEQRARLRTPNRRALLERVDGLGVALASHDDRTEADIAENAADGIRISEFPVTMVAATAAKAAGMEVIAGAPNIVRGGSHSGNVRAADLISAACGRCARLRLRAGQSRRGGLCLRRRYRDRAARGGRARDRPPCPDGRSHRSRPARARVARGRGPGATA